MFTIGALSANARWAKGETPVSAITAGQKVVLVAANNTGATDILKGASKVNVMTDDCVFEFESAGQTDGLAVWYLKNTNSGEYLQDPKFAPSYDAITYTKSRSRAFKFTAERAKMFGNADEAYAGDPRSATSCTTADNAFVFAGLKATKYTTEAGAEVTRYVTFNTHLVGAAPFFAHQYVDTNAWNVFPAEEAKGLSLLKTVFSELFPGDMTEFPVESYSVGTKPGQVSQAALDALAAAFKTAKGLIDEESTDAEACTAAATALQNANDAFLKALVFPTAGKYYQIWSNGKNESTTKDHAAIYDNGSGLVKTTSSYVPMTTADISKANHIWQLVNIEGKLYFKSFYTGQYIKTTKQSTPATLTETPESSYTIKYNTKNSAGDGNTFLAGTFNVVSDELPNQNFHCDNQNNLVLWGNTASAACVLTFEEVGQDIIDALSGQVAQQKLQTNLDNLYAEAQGDYMGTRSYTSEATKDCHYDATGLITDASQYSSNAAASAKSEPGSALANLLDGNYATYFHTAWAASEAPAEPHYLQADLGKQLQTLVFKYTKRNNNGPYSPKQVRILATNDTTGTWSDQGIYICTYPYAQDVTAEDGTVTQKANQVGLLGVEMDKPYQFIRFVCLTADGGSQTPNGYQFFYFSEFHIYEGAYDKATSILETIDQATRDNLTNAIAKAKTEVEGKSATQATYDALKTAHEAFMEKVPQPEKAKTLLEYCDALAQNAVEGTDMGYFETGSTDTSKAAVEAVRASVKDVMSLDEVNDAVAKLQAAIDELNSKLITPEEGTLYRIISGSEDTSAATAGQNLIFASNSDYSVVKWGGFDKETGDYTVDAASQLKYLWAFTKTADGKFYMRNAGTGLYMGGSTVKNELVKLSKEPVALGLRYANVAGDFNIVVGDGLYANAQPSGYRLVSWNSASGADNSAFKFEAISFGGTDNITIEDKTNPTIITMPYDYANYYASGIAYTPIGVTAANDKVVFAAVGDGSTIKGGQAVVYVPNADATAEDESLVESLTPTMDESGLLPKFDLETKSVNGLVGVLATDTLQKAGFGVLIEGEIYLTQEGEVIDANTGYFSGDGMTVTDQSGDWTATLEGALATAINKPVVVVNGKVDVYNLSGVLLRKGVDASKSTQGLPSGLYIVGGQKLLVK